MISDQPATVALQDSALWAAQADPLGRSGLDSFTTRHVYAGLETIEEYVDDTTNGWTLVREFLWGGGFPEMVALIDRSAAGDDPNVGNPEVLYPLHDTLGSVIGLVRAGDGELVEKVSYDPYGQTYFERPEPDPNDPNLIIWTRAHSITLKPWTSSAYGNPFLWTGQRHDAGVGLYHFKYRSYSPRLGRWIQRDPLMYVDGVSMYEYAMSSPANYVDLVGLDVFIEGTDAGAGWHERICVGDPDGDKFCISYGPIPSAMFGGGEAHVFTDNQRPREGDAEAVIETTDFQDRNIEELFREMVGGQGYDGGGYFFLGTDNCRGFCTAAWEEILEGLENGRFDWHPPLLPPRGDDPHEPGEQEPPPIEGPPAPLPSTNSEPPSQPHEPPPPVPGNGDGPSRCP